MKWIPLDTGGFVKIKGKRGYLYIEINRKEYYKWRGIAVKANTHLEAIKKIERRFNI